MSKREGMAWIVWGLLMWVVAAIVASSLTIQASGSQWAMKDCFTLDDVTAFLNTLPPDKAVTAKVLSINSQRSFLGVADTPYYVWYQK